MHACFTDLEWINQVAKTTIALAQQGVTTPGFVLGGPQEPPRKCVYVVPL